MAGSNQVVGLNGFELWVFVVELDDGVRVRLDIDDWQKLTSTWVARSPGAATGEERRVAVRHQRHRAAADRLGHDGEAGPGGAVSGAIPSARGGVRFPYPTRSSMRSPQCGRTFKDGFRRIRRTCEP